MSESLDEQIRKFQQQTESARKERAKDARYSRTARMHDDLASSSRFLYQVTEGFWFLKKWLFDPISRLIVKYSLWIWRQYRKLWSLVVYRKTSDDVLLFSKTRAGFMLLSTFVFVWFILYPVLDCVYEASLYLMTAQVDERVYLLGSQEIESTTGAHIIEGCSKLPCSDRDAIYFRTENTLFNNLWSIFHGRGLFYPEYVGAAVPYSTSRCVLTSYGYRFRMPFHIVNTYSYLLAVTCVPVGDKT